MKSVIVSVLVLAAGIAATGCGKTESDKPAESKPPTLSGPVEVPKEGKTFDPPIKPEQLPSGAWYCDMGTVHYARMQEGDGKCRECMMKLKKKP